MSLLYNVCICSASQLEVQIYAACFQIFEDYFPTDSVNIIKNLLKNWHFFPLLCILLKTWIWHWTVLFCWIIILVKQLTLKVEHAYAFYSCIVRMARDRFSRYSIHNAVGSMTILCELKTRRVQHATNRADRSREGIQRGEHENEVDDNKYRVLPWQSRL